MDNNEDLPASQQLSKNETIEHALSKDYSFQFNVVKCRSEFKKKTEDSEFQIINKYHINSLWRELYRNKINTSPEVINSILSSSFSPEVDPICQYFLSLEPKQNGAIEALAKTVIVTNPIFWQPYLTRWLVGVAANALANSLCLNHLCLTVTGPQGLQKSKFLDHLCPKKLKAYIFSGKIDVNSKDTLSLIAENLFINIDDQLTKLNKNDENSLKTLITLPSVSYRKPYSVFVDNYAHKASFMASVNGINFLTEDASGSRRFIAFEAKSIDFVEVQKINMDDVFSEVMYLYNSGFRYWFNSDEIDELNYATPQC